MRLSLTSKGLRTFSDSERAGIGDIGAFVVEGLKTGSLVLKDDSGNTGNVDDTGRDRRTRMGGVAPNERAPNAGDDASGQDYNESPSSPDAATGRTSRDYNDRLTTLENGLGKIITSLFGGPDALQKALGSSHIGDQHLPTKDEDDDPRMSRPYSLRSGRPTALTNDPDARALQDEIFTNPPDRGGSMPGGAGRERVNLDSRKKGPWMISQANENVNDQLVKALAEDAGFRVMKARGDFAVGNGAPLSREETHEVMKGLLDSMANGSGGRW